MICTYKIIKVMKYGKDRMKSNIRILIVDFKNRHLTALGSNSVNKKLLKYERFWLWPLYEKRLLKHGILFDSKFTKNVQIFVFPPKENVYLLLILQCYHCFWHDLYSLDNPRYKSLLGLNPVTLQNNKYDYVYESIF